MDFTMGPSYPQSLSGPTAPASQAARVLAAEMALVTAEKVLWTSLSRYPPAMNMATLAPEQFVSPPEMVLCFLQMFVHSSQM